MRILHINVRLNEGGAAKVALDLHRRLLGDGSESDFFYGYGPGARTSPDESSIPRSYKMASYLQVAMNFGLHRSLGIEAIPPHGHLADRFIKAVEHADAVHLHATHSYYLPLKWLVDHLVKAKKRVIWTAHDFWPMTGRCAFLEGCTNWESGCGSCPTQSNYPASSFDLSGIVYRRKRDLLARMKNLLTFAAPSRFVGELVARAFPDYRVVVIPNALDSDMEDILANYSSHGFGVQAPSSPVAKVLIVAHDLSDPTKIDRDLISRILALENVELHTIGKNSPFQGGSVKNHGEVSGRARLAELMSASDCLLFTSRKDTFGLVMAEALACGTPVIAVKSEAADEVLGRVGAVSIESNDLIIDTINRRDHVDTCRYPVDRSELRTAALATFSGRQFFSSYKALYAA